MQFYLSGCSSPCSQPVALSDLSRSGPSHPKHWNVRCPLPPEGSARIKKAPQWGQVSRLACPMVEFVAPFQRKFSAEKYFPEHDCCPKETQYFYGDGVQPEWLDRADTNQWADRGGFNRCLVRNRTSRKL